MRRCPLPVARRMRFAGTLFTNLRRIGQQGPAVLPQFIVESADQSAGLIIQCGAQARSLGAAHFAGPLVLKKGESPRTRGR